MIDPVIKKTILKIVPLDIQKFITLEFPDPNEWNCVIYGLAIHKKTRQKLVEHLDKKLKRLQVMGDLLAAKSQIHEVEEVHEGTPRKNNVPDEALRPNMG